MVTANKGEWSEFYAFLKILAERDVALADENLLARAGHSLTFLKVYRLGANGEPLTYALDGQKISILDEYGVNRSSISPSAVEGKLNKIFSEILLSKKTTFSIVEAETLAHLLLCGSIKAPSAEKADIVASIRDRSTGLDERAGFSIKSLVGGASTLLNAGRTTNFIYELVGLAHGSIDAVNSITGSSKIRDRVRTIISMGGSFQFFRMNEPLLERNLRKIDTMMPEFLAEMILAFYSGAGSSVGTLTGCLANHIGFRESYGLSREDYDFKIKQLLISIALGLVPSRLWDGLMLAHGGYLVVKPKGELVCYHAIQRDLFLEYLFRNTKFETASTTRHDFGKLYAKDGQIFMNLNLQIRFK